MSFNQFANKVVDPKISTGIRSSSLRSCILRIGWMRKESYLESIARFEQQVGYSLKRKLTVEQIINAFEIVQTERNQLLGKLRIFVNKRIEEKKRGKRQPSHRDIRELYE